MKRFRTLIPLLVLVVCVSFLNAAPINITYTVNPDGSKTSISPYVYGSNWGSGTDYTIRRSGGNRLTAYNWETNNSNAGADWWWNNDNYLSSSTIPGKVITDFHDSCLSQGQASIVTLQMAGYVAADDYGWVDCNTETAPSARFKPVVFAKGAPFCDPPGNPNTTDANVYMDECVNFLVSEYSYAGTVNGVKFYDLDNEPALWYQDGGTHATHWEVHPYRPTYLELKTKSIALSTAVKNVDPNAQILGCVAYGFAEYLDLQGASDKSTEGAGYNWYLSYLLDKMEAASALAGKRLLDVLDLHWYPEAQDGSGHRITDNVATRNMYTARMQAPRTLWDTGYVYPNMTFPNGEVSWINQSWAAQYLPLIPKVKNSINTYYPDTNLAFTEYDYGGANHWSGGIATSDFLGVLGKYGVYIATYWGDGSYVQTAMKMYINYDGSHSKFGDMNIPATTTNKIDSSVYASVNDGNDYVIHMIVINKNQDNDINATFNIASGLDFTAGKVWAFDGNSSSITQRTAISTITNNSFTYTIPKVSVCHFILTSPPPPDCLLNYDVTGDCFVDFYDLKYICDFWMQSGECSPDDGACPDLDHSTFIDFFDLALLSTEWGQ